MTTTHDLHLEYFQYWQIKVSFYTCSFVFMHDRMLRTILWSWTCPHTLADKIITQQSLQLNFHPGYFLTWGRPLGATSSISPCIHLPLAFSWPISLIAGQPNMSDYNFFSKGPSWWGEAFQSLWGHHDICPLLDQFHVASITQSELSSLTSLKAWGDLEKFQSNVTFLLVLIEECTAGDRVYGLSTMRVYPYQARVSTMEEAVKQLAPLIPAWPNWPYALVQLNMDACHVPLPKEEHLSILMEGGTSSATCRQISQLDVCQLLSSGSQVIYLLGLNGCEIPVITSLPESLAKGMTILRGEPIYLLVDILQSAMKGQESKGTSPGIHSIPILTASPIRAPLSKAEVWVSMTKEVRELLSWVVLDTSGQVSGDSTPKRLGPVVLVTPLPPKPEDFPKPVHTSSQAGTLGWPHPRGGPCYLPPTIKTPGPSSNFPSLNVAHLCKEANKALGDWLAVKSSIDACQWKLVSEFGMTLHQKVQQGSKGSLCLFHQGSRGHL